MAGDAVAVIVINWNGADDTIACLASLAATGQAGLRPYVVDNGSDDGSGARIRAARPEATIVASAENLGYAGACNLGLARALADGASHLWLLNNDTTVAPDAIAQFLAADRQVGPALLSPKILYHDRPDELWYAGGRFNPDLTSHHIGQDEPDRGQYDRLRPIAWATGCAIFLRAAVARELGPLDARYFLYLEDVDWSLRARARGLPVYFVPGARVYHRVSRSVGQAAPGFVRYYAWRNYYLLVSRHGAWWQRLWAYADLTSRFARIGLRYALFPSYRLDPSYQARTRGLIDFVAGRFGQRIVPSVPPLVAQAARGGGR